ncbi:hypothetical protein LTR47_005060 [Exophiala xenobiotica]|nr:hypothetical protein LTR47_005060 [Exophiala xenobiotica]KAK5249953.1 hypothetical protein LTS06_005168 [Exophiala xenobiotica]KAK5260318.1 hypothetical protein LTR40_004386 [Exophiala xenobiotica]KAK5351676.1 hypothetical protein LTR61_005026 [Exophiala xenobiotica]KAK5374743.1 hypothetical protein LTS13_005311 [Exophiala xenobiotica]
MASNHYRQQWQQGPTQVQQPYQYDQRNDQRQWQENSRSQGSYNQDNQRYNEHPIGRNGYGPSPAPAPAPQPVEYDRNGQWQGQAQGQNQYVQGGYQDPPYYDNGNGYSQPPQQRDPYHDQAPPAASRTYQYDERYRSNGQSRPQPEHQHSGAQRPSRDQMSGPSNPQKRSKTRERERERERERILPAPTSPKNLAWDNPFGAWPSKKKEPEKQRHASLDAELKNLVLDARPESREARPHTSHGHRKKEEQRPHTSHAQRPSSGDPPPMNFQMPPPVASMGRPSPEMNRPPPQEYQMPPPVAVMGRPSPEMNRPPPQEYQMPPPVAGRGRPPPEMNHPPAMGRHPRPQEYQMQPPEMSRSPPVSRQPPDLHRPPPLQDFQMPPRGGSLDMNRPQPFRSQENVPPSPRGQPRHPPDLQRPPLLQDVQMPPRSGSMDMHRPQPLRSQENVPPSPRRLPRQDPRGPTSRNDQDQSRPGPYGGFDSYGSQEGYDTSRDYQPPQDPRRNEYMQEDGYHQDHIPPSRAYESPTDPPQKRQPARPPRPENFELNNYRGVPNSAGLGKTRSHDMPNFDAIPTKANESPEDHISVGQGSYDQQIYRKPTYQVPGAFPGGLDTTQNKRAPPNDLGSPLAEFSFDIPSSTNNGQLGRGQPPASYQNSYGEPKDYGSRQGLGGYENNQRQQPQYPPRGASRNGMKPPPVGDLPPIPSNGPGYRSFSQDQYPARPHTSNAERPAPQPDLGAEYDRSYSDQHRAPSAPVPGQYNQGYSPSPSQQLRQPYGQGPPARTMSQDNYAGGPPPGKQSQDNYNPVQSRPPASSAHPVPVRQYGGANVNVNVNANPNPDALPAHPEPVRSSGNGYQPQPPPAPQPMQRKEVSTNTSGRDPPPVSSQELNSLRVEYSRNPANYAVGLKLAKKEVEAAKVLADEGGKADAKQTQKNREKYIFDAHKLVKKMVAANYPEAMFYLADCHGQGLLGLAVDPKEAFHLYQSAAKLNHPQSAYRVAVCCELGSEEGGGTRRDPMKAIQWYKRAATLGDTPAMYKIGMILLKGLLGQPKNPREAVSWLKRAAERADKDNPHALHELGLLYESASGNDTIIRDEKYAFQLFQQASELGYKYSQFRMGSAYEYGLLGCPIDPRQSIAWYTRAAAQAEHQSELALSGWYLTGSEPLLQQSDTEAFLWARKAASSGLAKAEYAMGYFYEVGIGTAVDVEEAKRWYYRAASQNFPKARERLEELKRGQKMQKTRVSRSNVNRQGDGECVVM